MSIRNASTIHPTLVESTVELSGRGDFIVQGKFTFEVGGKGKDFKQISGMENAFVAAPLVAGVYVLKVSYSPLQSR